jgi:hypothetical protein
MCVIITLPLGTVPPFEPIRNAILNNPHGFGFISVDRGKIETYKEVDLDKGNDPDKIYKAITETKGVTRYLHVRNNTVGSTSKDNCHPFTVFAEDGRRVEFMHNGTIHQYKPGNGSQMSDTQNYAVTWLLPLLKRFRGEKGMGDYTDPFFRQLIGSSIFGSTNRGLLVGNDLEPLYLGQWTDLKLGDDIFRVSNTDYFGSVRDYRVHDGRKESREVIIHGNDFRHNSPSTRNKPPRAPFDASSVDATEAETSVENSRGQNSGSKITELKDVKLGKLPSKTLTAADLESIYAWGGNTIDELDDETLSYMTYVTDKEIIQFTESKPMAAGLLLCEFIARFAKQIEYVEQLTEQLESISEKHQKATDRISDLKAEIGELEKGKVVNVG